MEKTFEESIKELEKIVNDMDNNELPLEDSIKMFEEGMALSEHCYKILDKAEKKITKILEKNGEIVEEEL